MKKEQLLIGLAAGLGAAVVTYSFLSKDLPDGAAPVYPFDKERYMGVWNEIARLPNFFERNINQLTETYTLNDDGTMNVLTRGYNTKKDKWVEVQGKLEMAEQDNVGMLDVSYLGPLWLSYNVLDIDPEYKHALVSGSGLGFLWILSKEQSIPDDIKEQFLNTATRIGFKIDKLEWM